MRRLAAVLLSTVCVVLGVFAAAAPASAAPRHSYYLSLGDSLAFGYQPNLVAAGDVDPAHYRSYAEYYALLHPRLTLVNYGCSGETTDSMINGGCPWLQKGLPLHDSYGAAPSQLAAASAFLEAHGAQTSLVTIDIGSNDLLALAASCQAQPDPTACLTAGLPATLGTLARNLGTIVGTVHALAPGARIVVFTMYNPLALTLPGSDQLVAVVNDTVTSVASAFGARLADSFRAINGRAGSPAEKPLLCALTWECSSYRNVHPTTVGYLALTVALLRVAR
jgi:lysophospholipase L1-like esterase